MASQGPLLAGTGTDDAGVGTVTWASTGNITVDDGTRSTASNLRTTNGPSHYLKSGSHGFSIPAGATIVGIVVEVDRSQSAAQQVRDNRVRIIKADGTIGTTARADTTTDWPTPTDTTKTYGDATDLWGETWTPADINDADFGVAISALNASATNSNARIDFIRITVYYTEAHALAGQSNGVGTTAGNLTAQRPLEGASAGGSTTTGELTITRPLAASVAGASTVVGDLIVAHPLAGQADGVGAAQGDLTEALFLLGAAAGSSGAIGDLLVARVLAGEAAGAGGASGDMQLIRALLGQSAGTSTAIGDLSTLQMLVGLAAGASGATGRLSVNAAEGAYGWFEGTVDLEPTINLTR